MGGFKIDEKTAPGQRHEYGPYESTRVTRRSCDRLPHSGLTKPASDSFFGIVRHLSYPLHQSAESQGQEIGELPEQVPYQEWLHSEYKETKSCQFCHMPVVAEDVPITSVFGEPRRDSRATTLLEATFSCSVCSILHRNDLAVAALPRGNRCRRQSYSRSSSSGGG